MNGWPLVVAVAAMTLIAGASESVEGSDRDSPVEWFVVGLLSHDVDGLWSGSRRESGVDANLEVVLRRTVAEPFGGNVRPVAGITVNSACGTDAVYGGMVWERRLGRHGHVAAGIELALHDGDLEPGDAERKALGSRVLFRVPLEVGVDLAAGHRLSLAFAHMSNAYLATPNEGLDTVGLRYGFRF